MTGLRFLFIFISIMFVACDTQNPEHHPEPYNKEVNRAFFKEYFPNQNNYSYATSGNTKAIKPLCPEVSSDDKYITINYEFENGLDPKEIALLNVFMHKRECENNKCEWKAISDNYFLPSPYSNKARFKNYLPEGEYRFWYGFYLKKDSISEFPKFYKATCYLTIE